jgi:hypothetical protein
MLISIWAQNGAGAEYCVYDCEDGYDGFVPIPGIGDAIAEPTNKQFVKSRTFRYTRSDDGMKRLRVTLQVAEFASTSNIYSA